MNTASALQRALARPWLRPTAAALLTLADDAPSGDTARLDPGFLLHFLRFAKPAADPLTLTLSSDALAHPQLAHYAAELLHRDAVPSGIPPIADCSWAGHAAAHAAESGVCSADAAWIAAFLATLFQGQASLARTLLTRWRQPTWLIALVGYPELPTDEVIRLGGHADLTRVVRDTRPIGEADFTLALPDVDHTHQFPIIAKLLRTTAKLRQQQASTLIHDLEGRVQTLSDALARLHGEFDRRVRDAKLDSLAEFAAGASHEINNPLAVIATNVQLLRSEEDDANRLLRYDAVLRQTKRIHELLAGARLYVRPVAPHPTRLAASTWVAAVAKDYEDDADDRGVTLEFPAAMSTVRIFADAGQVRQAVGQLVKNAMEAAGSGGWVRVHLDGNDTTAEIVVEDSGAGPTAAAVPHLFDPFYSGRAAGRGRGLGLPIAWRLAKINGGDVRFETTTAGTTRFVLTLPAEPTGTSAAPLRDRKTA